MVLMMVYCLLYMWFCICLDCSSPTTNVRHTNKILFCWFCVLYILWNVRRYMIFWHIVKYQFPILLYCWFKWSKRNQIAEKLEFVGFWVKYFKKSTKREDALCRVNSLYFRIGKILVEREAIGHYSIFNFGV